MSIFVINGRVDCPNFAHAVHVAEYLQKNLPDFDFIQIGKYESEWEDYLRELNASKKWHVKESPLIWKEISRSGGKAYLIGGLSEFWEYCYDYYGFESSISKEDLKGLVADKMKILEDSQRNKTIKIVTITGASNLMIEFVLLELQKAINLRNQDQAIFRLYDKTLEEDEEKGEFLMEVAEQMQILMQENVKSIVIVSSLTEAIENCDLLIVMDDFSRLNQDEITNDWLWRCMLRIRTLSEEIQENGKRSLRVVFSHLGPTCFNASILMEFCTSIRLANIVAVTADEGLRFIQTASEKTEIPVEDMGCPPVWGFSGVASFVDVNNVVVRADVCRPFTRASRLKDGSVLSKGKITRELRLLSYALESEESVLHSVYDKKKKQEALLKRPSLLPKVRATISLLKLWFTDEPGDEVISLGVCSNGAFGLPIGVCFSQPAVLNERSVWEPFADYPIDSTAKLKLKKLMPEVQSILKHFDLGQKRKDSTSLI